MVADKAGRFISGSKFRFRTVDASALYARIMARLARYAGLRLFRVFTRRIGASPQGIGSDFHLRFMSEPELLSACVDPTLGLSPSKIRAAYARGDLCVGALYGAELAGYCWFAFSAVPQMDGAWLDFSSDAVYTYKSFVRRSCRGRGIAAAMYRFVDAAALERGRKLAIICVESHNSPSIAAARRAGFSDAGYAAYVGAKRLRAWCSRRAARYGLRFFVPSPACRTLSLIQLP